jgi:hypothetical protein
MASRPQANKRLKFSLPTLWAWKYTIPSLRLTFETEKLISFTLRSANSTIQTFRLTLGRGITFPYTFSATESPSPSGYRHTFKRPVKPGVCSYAPICTALGLIECGLLYIFCGTHDANFRFTGATSLRQEGLS